MLKYYLQHQEEVITRRTKFELNKAEERAHILEGLLIALDKIEDVDTKEMVTNLIPKIKNYSLEDLKNIDNIFE